MYDGDILKKNQAKLELASESNNRKQQEKKRTTKSEREGENSRRNSWNCVKNVCFNQYKIQWFNIYATDFPTTTKCIFSEENICY